MSVNYSLCVDSNGNAILLRADNNPPSDLSIKLDFTAHNHFDENVSLKVSLHQIENSLDVIKHQLKLQFIDDITGDQIYSISGMLIEDDEQSNSIVSIIDALEDFDDAMLSVYGNSGLDGTVSFDQNIKNSSLYNEINTLGRKFQKVIVPAILLGSNSIFDIITSQDDLPTVLYMVLYRSILTLTELMRVANKLRIPLLVELDPALTLEQAVEAGKQLQLLDHHVRLYWSPILARPMGASGLKGKLIPRLCGGTLLGEYIKRQANTDSSGIPAIHRPIAGFDFPITFLGIKQNPQVILNDSAMKALAQASINVVKRERFPQGIRFIIADSITTYGDKTSALKLANSSEISMLIDSRLIEICKRHLQKDIESMIDDATKDSVKFLNACTTKKRPLLRKSKVLGGFYDLKITPRDDRPHDAIDLECNYLTQGTGRAVFLKTTVERE
ncbi:hypothetical protein KTH44_21965 [Acinetobacter bereziniae]|uniref:hypothetical protein n=1 Tax=Acinetobacter bereziniae TaxID=106648 RepID=UPI0021CD28E0|nr:hypothetical protein [Acinetobacter bereziniae]MCU4321765.1 hypothetical protein [Acinetobacter bereziniae]